MSLRQRNGGNMIYRGVDEKVWRGSRPETAEDFKHLKDMGIKTILNLEYGLFEWLHRQTNHETANAVKHGLIPVHVGMSDVRAPAEDDLDTCLAVMSCPFYLPVYVHCYHGVDRTGIVCAAYRVMVQNRSYEEAVGEMFELGFHKIYFWWPGVLKGYCDRVRKYYEI